MLSRERLVELNDYMLGLGMPEERDDIGYNRPDWFIMNNLAYIPSNKLSDLQVCILANTLKHYENTQLTEEKEAIRDTVDHYDSILKNSFNRDYVAYVEFGTTDFLKGANAEYIPTGMQKSKHYNIIEVVSLSEKGALLDFEDVRVAHTFKNQNDDVYYTNKNGKWQLFVPYEKLQEFATIMAQAKKKGIDGYEPNDKLKKILENPLKFKEYLIEQNKQEIEEAKKKNEEKLTEEEQKKLMAYHVSIEKKDEDSEKFVLFYGKFSREMVDLKNKNRDKISLKQDGNSRWLTVVSFDFVEEWVKEAEKNGLIIPTELKEFNYETYEKGKLEKHKGEYELIDLDKLSLPFTPYEFQIEDAKKLLERDRMLVGHDMGCGKTFISGLVGSSIEGKKLVICPETLRRNWKKEMENLGKTVDVLYSKDVFHVNPDPNGFTVCGYQTAHKYEKELINANFNVVFVDEVHNCKSVDNKGVPSSNRAESVINITKNSKYAYLLSGTPIPTRNKDLFNTLRMLDVKEINFKDPWVFMNYGKEYCDGVNNGYGWDFSGNSNSDGLHEVLAPYMVRRTKKEVLPNLTKQRLFIPLEIENKEYRAIEKRIYEMDDGDTYMGLAMTGRRFLSESKVKSAIEFADGLLNEDKSVVIVSNFNDTLDTLKEKYGDDCCVIRGGMSDIQKQNAIDDFQSGKRKVCALNIIAGGVGITLTKAHDMIVCDYDWTPANMIQVEDRICRVGQTESCNIHYLYGEDCLLDELFVDMITNKNANIDLVIDKADNGMNLVAEKEENSGSYIEILRNHVENDKAKDFDKKGLIDNMKTQFGDYQLSVEKNPCFLDKKNGYPMYNVELRKDGEVVDTVTLSRKDISDIKSPKDKVTVNRLNKLVEAYVETYDKTSKLMEVEQERL